MSLVLVQIGLLVKDQVIVEEAARAGAREAAVSTDDGQVRQAVISAAVGLDETQLDITVTRQGGAGSAVTVTVLYHAAVEIPLVTWLLPPSVETRGVAVMRQEVG